MPNQSDIRQAITNQIISAFRLRGVRLRGVPPRGLPPRGLPPRGQTEFQVNLKLGLTPCPETPCPELDMSSYNLADRLKRNFSVTLTELVSEVEATMAG